MKDGRGNNLFAITIKNPWAYFILEGIKPVENRSWQCGFRGVLLIHASKQFDDDWQKGLGQEALHMARKKLAMLNIARSGHSPWVYSAVIGAVIITGSDQYYLSDWCQVGQNYIWFSNPIKFKNPIPCKGKQRIFHPEIELQQISTEDRISLNNLYDYSISLGLQSFEISDFKTTDSRFKEI